MAEVSLCSPTRGSGRGIPSISGVQVMLYPVISSEATGVRVQEKVREVAEESIITNSSKEANTGNDNLILL